MGGSPGDEGQTFDASLDVALFHDEMWLENRTDDALVGGPNAALVGDETVQFGAAEPLGGGRFRLLRLLRDRRGTETESGEFVYSSAALAVDGAAAATTHFTLSLARIGSIGRSMPDSMHNFDL